MNSLAARLKSLREAARLNQTELAKLAGLSASAVSRIESDDITPQLATVDAWAAACGVAAYVGFRRPEHVDRGDLEALPPGLRDAFEAVLAHALVTDGSAWTSIMECVAYWASGAHEGASDAELDAEIAHLQEAVEWALALTPGVRALRLRRALERVERAMATLAEARLDQGPARDELVRLAKANLRRARRAVARQHEDPARDDDYRGAAQRDRLLLLALEREAAAIRRRLEPPESEDIF